MTTMTELEVPEARDVRHARREPRHPNPPPGSMASRPTQPAATLPAINPATVSTSCRWPRATPPTSTAPSTARAAFDSGEWSRMAPSKRKRVLIRFAELIEPHADELALLETLDMGKPIRDARNVDIPLAAECIACFGEACDKVYDEVAPADRRPSP